MELILHPEMLVVEHYLTDEFLGDWPDRVLADGIVPYFRPDEPSAVSFAQERRTTNRPLDLVLVDLDLPHPHPRARPVYLLGVLRGIWPGIPATFFSRDAELIHLIGMLPPPCTFYHRRTTLPDFLATIRPHLLTVRPDGPNENPVP